MTSPEDGVNEPSDVFYKTELDWLPHSRFGKPEVTMQVVERLTVSYESEEHKRYAELLMRYGFSFQVTAPNMRVGRVFTHPVKSHRVFLEQDDPSEDLTPKLYVFRPGAKLHGTAEFPRHEEFDVPIYPSHYSDLEWQALQGDKPDDFTFFERELHIWFKVRPKSLNTQLKLD